MPKKQSTIKPLRDQVILEPAAKEDKTESGLYLPETADKPRPEQGIVVAVGPDVKSNIKKGNTVLFSKYGPTEVTIAGKDYLVAKEEDLLAIIE